MKKLVLVLLAFTCAIFAQAQKHVQDVVYGHKMGVALTMDVFQPAKPNGIGVIWIVSGGWVSNHNNINPIIAKPFTDRGMTVFQVVHGSQPKFQMPEILSDVYRAVRFIRSNAATYGVDPNRLGVSGGSAGGHLSLMIGTHGGPGDPDAKDPVDRAGSEVQAVACLFPPTDMLNYGETGRKAFTVPLLRAFWPAFGVTDKTTPETLEQMAKDYSPIYAVTAKMPPTLIIHGDKDALVPIQQSEIFIAKLKSLGIDNKLVVRTGMGHGWLDMSSDLVQLADWFASHLTKK